MINFFFTYYHYWLAEIDIIFLREIDIIIFTF